ncbi:MAG TPA: hypothetical protein PLR60_01725 [Syntrophorhabdaceae bacterium]|nr:hypothetical protein [Syntrophorhabdaceae bacterium]
MANLIGMGKQFLPRGQIALSEEGQNAFFDILAGKMGDAENVPFFSMPVENAVDTETGVPQEEAGAGQGPVAASLDPGDISLLVASLLSVRDISFDIGKAFENKDAGAPDIIGFLKNVLEVLSDGDQIELESTEEGMDVLAAALPEEGESDGLAEQAKGSGNFMGQLASVIHQLNRLAARGNEETTGQAQMAPPAPGIEIPDAARETKRPDPAPLAADQTKGSAQTAVSEGQEAPAFVVEIVKAAKRIQAREVSPVKDDRSEVSPRIPAAADAADAAEAKDSFLIRPARADAVEDNAEVPKKVVIRVLETNEAGPGDEREGRIAAHQDHSRQSVQNASETKASGKNDFGAMMVDKIEKMTEQFAGKNMNMDMVVRLKIDEKETLLVGLKEDGGRINVEVRTTNENMMNFLQSQKEDIAKNLEGKNIHTSIHVDLNQDGSGRRDRKNDHAGRDDDEQDKQDFSAFVEALS